MRNYNYISAIKKMSVELSSSFLLFFCTSLVINVRVGYDIALKLNSKVAKRGAQ